MQTWNTEWLALSLLSVAMLAFLLPRPAHADEGLWTFDNFPSAAVKAKYGVDINPAWLDHVRGAALRLSTGRSASIVTVNGIGPVQSSLRPRLLTIHDINIPSLGGAFGFEARVDRGISVSTASITEALRNVYGAQGWVTELIARD